MDTLRGVEGEEADRTLMVVTHVSSPRLGYNSFAGVGGNRVL